VPRIHLVSNLPGASALGDHLRGAGLPPTTARSADALLVLIDRPLDNVEQDLLDRARQSVPVLLAGPTLRSLPADSPLVEASGVVPGRVTPVHELRITPGPQGQQVAARLGDFRPIDAWVIPDKVSDDVEQLLMVRHELVDHPVCTWRPSTGMGMLTLGSGVTTLADPAYHRLIGRWLRHALGLRDSPPARVGLLGTSESGATHHAAIDATEGLELAAICDGGSARQPMRGVDRAVARLATPAELISNPDLDLVFVSTPTHTHVEWATRALEAGKHVVVEQPFCLTAADADGLMSIADERGLLLAVHADQRDDPGYRALRGAVRAGSVGEVFWFETFQGGYHRPLGTWHDDERISGGVLYDRGFTDLDWVLDLIPTEVEWVSATTQKRIWHHVSNADHTRVLIHFVDGTEAQVTVSDVAAARVPRLHLLGTAGSLVSDLPEAAAAPTRSGRHSELPGGAVPAPVSLVTAAGDRTRLALPPPVPPAFHREIADRLVSGWPTSYPVAASRRVVAVMEAARSSAAASGTSVPPAAAAVRG
jgi:scyllo-inositol 2-dehydrogenase (NADP+)